MSGTVFVSRTRKKLIRRSPRPRRRGEAAGRSARAVRPRRHLLLTLVAVMAALWAWSMPVSGQVGRETGGDSIARTEAGLTESSTRSVDLGNPLDIVREASRALPIDGIVIHDGSADLSANVSGGAAEEDSEGLSATLSILALLTILTIAPSLVILMTSFTRIVVVLALLRQAIGTQSLPPSQVIIGLSLFMTFLVMAPTFDQINKDAITPLQNNEMEVGEAWEAAKKPLRDFMFAQIDHADNWDSVFMILEYRGTDTSNPDQLTEEQVDMLTLVPAFVLSELKVAFLMGFRLYLPFLIVDMVVSSVLISMGMIMLPPVLISLPFKLLLFVLVDGWQLVAGSLLHSFATVPGTMAFVT